MTMWVDNRTGRYRVSFISGRARKTKLLPAGLTEVEAQAAHDKFCSEVFLGRLAVPLDVEARWTEHVLRSGTAKTSWLHNALKGAKQRAKSKKVPFSLTMDDLLAICRRSGGRCEVTGIEFSDLTAGGKMRPFSPSFDRRVPALGYTIENCRLVCSCVNVAMFTWGEAVFRSMAFGYTMNELTKAKGTEMATSCTMPQNEPAEAKNENHVSH